MDSIKNTLNSLLETLVIENIIINFLTLFVLLMALTIIINKINGYSSEKTLSIDDNPAAGIYLTSSFIALSIIIMGIDFSKLGVVMSMTLGSSAIILNTISNTIIEYATQKEIGIKKQIKIQNTSAAIIGAGWTISNAIIITSLIIWTVENREHQLYYLLLIFGFVFSQILIVFINKYIYNFIQKEKSSTQQEIKENNHGLAFLWAGQHIGAAIAIATAQKIIVQITNNISESILYWFTCAIILIFIHQFISKILINGILSGINIKEEVIRDNNLAIGLIQGSIYMICGLTLHQSI